ncbi:hypothetical protein Tco_1548366 [Tanacetum coccineum]
MILAGSIRPLYYPKYIHLDQLKLQGQHLLRKKKSRAARDLKKGSNLVREVHEKQNLSKSRQCFSRHACSKLGNILGAEKSAEQIDADKSLVGEK